MATELNKYGFFNGVFGIEQSNWADYWKGVIPDGVVANSGTSVDGHKEMEVYPSLNFGVNVAPGEVMVDNHKGWNMTSKFLACEDADQYDSRIDSVVVRVVYGNDGESRMELDVVKGTPAQTPDPPQLRQETGVVYEYRLANILINSDGIGAKSITDERYVFSMGAGSITPFKEEEYTDDENELQRQCILNVIDGREYRTAPTDKITNNIVVNLPKNPVSTFMCEIDFTSGTEEKEGKTFDFAGDNGGVHFMRNDREYKIKCSNLIASNNARYNILIWWDGVYFWADCKVVSL